MPAPASSEADDRRAIIPLGRPCDAELRVPGSKSITNRALIIAALAEGDTVLTGALFSDDSRYCADALLRLGFPVALDETAQTCRVTGAGGHIPARSADLFAGNSGTAIRFLT